MPTTSQNNYDRLSSIYDLFARSELRFILKGLEFINARRGDRILEIGCGTGHALFEMGKSNAAVTGLDISAGMLSQARRRLKNLAADINLIQGDALNLPFESGSFSGVFISFALELFTENDISVVLKGCRRVLKPSGRLGLVAMERGDTLAIRIYSWAHRRWPEILDCRPIDTGRLIATAGFDILQQRSYSMWGLPVSIVLAK